MNLLCGTQLRRVPHSRRVADLFKGLDFLSQNGILGAPSLRFLQGRGATFENGLSVRALRTRASQYGSVSFANGGFGLAGGGEIVLPGAAIEDAFGRLGL